MPDLKMLNTTKYLYKLTFIKCSYERSKPFIVLLLLLLLREQQKTTVSYGCNAYHKTLVRPTQAGDTMIFKVFLSNDLFTIIHTVQPSRQA